MREVDGSRGVGKAPLLFSDNAAFGAATIGVEVWLGDSVVFGCGTCGELGPSRPPDLVSALGVVFGGAGVGGG